ncbi:TonB-dependent receptor domain-containing protein [Methyloversatilis sp.]|uniref:TonB-dependent receptor domain-containing protein n=1 Tax=Methyloversatilis sp. TaxID=2569862 RepID=UPI0035B33756
MPASNFTAMRRLTALVACLCLQLTAALAQTLPDDPEDDVVELKEVQVREKQEPDDRIHPTQSVTRIEGDGLSAKVPANLFEAVREVPGVSINGGVRASGMSFEIRGFNSNEDVRVTVDGVAKGFEKYRFGGTFVEPELLKSIEIQRGPQIASNSGAIGGTVRTTTKDASDLLAPGERIGASLRTSHASNNDEWMRSMSLYGRPHERLDLLANVLERDADDFRLANGKRYAYSAVRTDSALLKASWWLLDDLVWSYSLTTFKDQGLQPFDAQTGNPGVGGIVQRAVDDVTHSHNVRYAPAGQPLIDLKGVFGYSSTDLHDLHRVGQSTFASALTGERNDYWSYAHTSIDLSNRARFGRLGWMDDVQVLAGVQYEKNSRQSMTYVVNRTVQAALYPGGYNSQQPPGSRFNYGVYVQPQVTTGRWTWMPGLRHDHYKVSAGGPAAARLALFGEDDSVSVARWSPSFGLAFAPSPGWAVFYNYLDSFRPPLVDEYFTQGTFGRCSSIYLGSAAPPSGMCGDAYRPQTFNNQEVGVSLQAPAGTDGRGQVNAKLVYFRTRTRALLSSLTAVDGQIVQPGHSERSGVEFELNATIGACFGSLSYSRLQGTEYTCPETTGGFCFASAFLKRPPVEHPLLGAGDTLNLRIGARFFDDKLELSYLLRDVSARDVFNTAGAIVNQDGYRLHGVQLRLTPSRNLEVQVAGENLGNTAYFTNAGQYQGIEAPGRNLRVALTLRY